MTIEKLDVGKLINSLEEKAKKAQSQAIEEEYDAAGLSRLKSAFKEYSGDDKIISTKDVVDNLKQQGEVYKILTG